MSKFSSIQRDSTSVKEDEISKTDATRTNTRESIPRICPVHAPLLKDSAISRRNTWAETILSNIIFQDIVLSPTLWNSFFSDMTVVASYGEDEDRLIVDRLNLFRKFPLSEPNIMARTNMTIYQRE